MPIKPENRGRYPKNWKEIRQQILERANNKCEFCGVENHSIRENGTKVVLTIAHLDHTPENCDPSNLKALCQKCHLAYDKEHHKQTAAKTRELKKKKMIDEDYVSFETAKLLKERGFDEGCYSSYDLDGNVHHDFYYAKTDLVRAGLYYWRPTLQMVLKWLREVYQIYVMIDKDFATVSGWHYFIVTKTLWETESENATALQDSNRHTYEQATEAAILYCLRNLI